MLTSLNIHTHGREIPLGEDQTRELRGDDLWKSILESPRLEATRIAQLSDYGSLLLPAPNYSHSLVPYPAVAVPDPI